MKGLSKGGTNRADLPMRIVMLAACAAFAVLAAPAQAQESQVDKVYACAGVSDGAARLACFDAAVAAMKQAQTAGDVSVIDPRPAGGGPRNGTRAGRLRCACDINCKARTALHSSL